LAASSTAAPSRPPQQRVVGADDGVLDGIGQQQQHHQVEAVELGEFAFAGKAQGQHQEQVHGDGSEHLLQ
jgi:hypothetical protein